MAFIRITAQVFVFALLTLTSQMVSAQTCIKQLTSENLVNSVLLSEAFDKDTTLNNVLLASWIFRSGYPNQAESFLDGLATSKGNSISLQPQDWSPAIGIIKAAQSDAEFDVSELLATISDPDLSKIIAKDMIPAALIGAGRAGDFFRHYPVGKTLYTQNLWGGTGIRLLARSGYDSAAVALYRKHDLGYHSARLLDILASELLALQDIEYLEEFLAEETVRVSEFSKDGTYSICMAGGVNGVAGDPKTCRTKSDRSTRLRALELFDQNSYTNCYLTGARQSQEQVDACLAGIQKRLDASGVVYSARELAGDVHSSAMIAKIAKFNGLIALPNPPDLPSSVYTDMEIEDVITISAHVAGMIANGEPRQASAVLEKAFKAYNASLDVKKTGASALFGFRSPQIPIYLNTLPFSYLATVFENFGSVDGLLDGLAVVQETKESAKDHPELYEAFEKVELDFVRSLLRLYVQADEKVKLRDTMERFQVKNWDGYPLVLTGLAVWAQDMYSNQTADSLIEMARVAACENPNFPRQGSGFLTGRDERVYLKHMFLLAAVKEDKLSMAVLGHVK